MSSFVVGPGSGAGGRARAGSGGSGRAEAGERLAVAVDVGPLTRAFLAAVVIAAAVLQVVWVRSWLGPTPTGYLQMAMYVGLAVAAQHFPLVLTSQYKIDISIGVYFTCLLLFGPPVAMILVAVSQFAGYATLRLRQRHFPHLAGVSQPLDGWRELLFDTSQLMLATGLGGAVYAALVSHWAPAPLNVRQNLWAIPATSATIYLVSTLLVSVKVGLQRRQNPLKVWLSAWYMDAIESAGIFLVGLVAAILSIWYPWAPLIMVFPAAGIYLSLRRNMTLAEQATMAMEAEHARAVQAEQLAKIHAEVGGAADLVDALEALLRGAILLLHGEHGVAHVFGIQSGEFTSVELVLNAEGQLEKWAPLADHPVAKPSVGSSLSAPIRANGRHIGSIEVTHREPGHFGRAEQALMPSLAAQAGAAIERARLEAARREAVTARQQAMIELARQSEELAKREAEAAALLEVDRLKNEFLSTVSHELRTPLTVIDGYSQWLEAQASTMDTRAIQSTADRIHSASAQLVRLIQDILDFARLQRGEVLVQPAEVDLTPVLQEVGEGIRRQPGGERVTWDVPPALPAFADGTRVVQVVSNLVENAVKYAPESLVQVSAVHCGATIRVAVEDSGPGIPLDEQPRVWEKFYRAQDVVQLNLARGTGIGLAVVKALVEAQGGRVGLDSTPGVGSRFWFEVPATATAPVRVGGGALESERLTLSL